MLDSTYENVPMTLCIESDRVIMLKADVANLVPVSMTPSTETGLSFHSSLIIKLLATSAFCLCGSVINDSRLYHRVWVESALTAQ
jgi:hypothetical protein